VESLRTLRAWACGLSEGVVGGGSDGSGTWLTVQIGKVQVGLNFEQETKEANFRYSLVSPPYRRVSLDPITLHARTKK